MAWERTYYVYFMASNKHSTLYIGVTNSLERRVREHRNPATTTFAARYHCIHLVYFEAFSDVLSAITREKQIKGWRRSKKNALVENLNPHWHDIAEDLFPAA